MVDKDSDKYSVIRSIYYDKDTGFGSIAETFKDANMF